MLSPKMGQPWAFARIEPGYSRGYCGGECYGSWLPLPLPREQAGWSKPANLMPGTTGRRSARAKRRIRPAPAAQSAIPFSPHCNISQLDRLYRPVESYPLIAGSGITRSGETGCAPSSSFCAAKETNRPGENWVIIKKCSCSNSSQSGVAAMARAVIGSTSVGRESPADIQRKATLIHRQVLLRNALDLVPLMVAVLNANRQIVFANRRFRDTLNMEEGRILGKRPGEVLSCRHCFEGPDGCGTGKGCRTCGALGAILESQALKEEITRECRLSVSDKRSSMELRVTATPFCVHRAWFILLAIENIAAEKQLEALQRTFFHDVLNTCGAVEGYARLLKDDQQYDPEAVDGIVRLSRQVIEMIEAHRDLLRAERGILTCKLAPVATDEILDAVQQEYEGHPVCQGRTLTIGNRCGQVVHTDRRLLLRVLGNMVKNALEAIPEGGMVTLACHDQSEAVVFSVHNPGVMPREVQLQIFHRSFSTKEESGRGIGTFSMKLLGEGYLGGKVSFVSEPPDGTTFQLRLPKTR